MDDSLPLVVWVLIISALTIVTLVAVVAIVFGWNQRRLTAEAERWGRQILVAQEAERQEIACELHDDLIPRLSAARLAVERSDSGDAENQLGEITTLVRRLAHDLYPSGLEYTDLPRALEEFVGRHRNSDGSRLLLHVKADHDVTGATAIALYRVAQEAVTNARKHAKARTIRLTLETAPHGAILSVEDDGNGMPPQTSVSSSFGMRSMRERLRLCGGALELQAVKPHGTRVVARVPLS